MSRLVLSLLFLGAVLSNLMMVSCLPTNHNDRNAFQRRIGPFSGNNRLPLGSFHQTPLNYQNGQLEEGILEPPKQEVAKRKLLLPIISEGYASTNFQGGSSSKDKDTSKKENSKGSDTEIKEAVSTKTTTIPTTTTTTRRTTRPTPTTSKRVIFRDETTPAPTRAPVINGYLFDELDAPKIRAPPAFRPSRPQVRATTTTTTTAQSPYGRPLPLRGHFTNPSQGRPTSFVQPAFNIPDQPSLAFDTQSVEAIQDDSDFIDRADPQDSEEEDLPAFAETDNGQVIELYQGELITADNNPEGELVHFSFSPPQQSAGTKDKPVSLNSKPSSYEIPSSRPIETTPRPYRPQPPSPPQQDIYQAGYEQINVPDHTTHHRPGGPEKFDPNAFHEDRPALSSNQQQSQQSQSDSDYYPLGKPVHLQAPSPPHGPPAQSQPNGSPRPKPTSSAGSFFDFLIPSFIRSKPERPNRRPPPPPQKRPPPPNNRPPRPPPQNRRHNYPIPSVPHIDPPRLDLNAPYGSPQNPILLHLPESFGQFPPPPQLQRRTSHARFEDHHNAPPEPNELDESVIVNRLGEEVLATIPDVQDLENEDQNNVIMGTVEEVDLTADLSIRRPHDHIQVPGISKAVPTRQQAPFLPSRHVSHPLQAEQDDDNQIKGPKQPMALPYKLAEYRHKLQDPEFLRNITQAHVFHYKDPVQAEATNIADDEPVSYIEESNPFFLRQDNGVGYEPIEELQAPHDQILDLTEFAPPAKPKHYQTRTSKPDVNIVYNPNERTTSRPLANSMEPSFSVEPGHPSQDRIEPPSVDTGHPIAQQISSFLEYYLQNPKVSDKAPIVSLSEDKVNPNYLKTDNEVMDHPEESFEVGLDEDVASSHDGQNTQPEEQLEEVFIASDSPQDSDWYILDTQGRRVMKDKFTEEPKITTEDLSDLESDSPTTIIPPTTTDSSSFSVSTSERSVEGGFLPVSVQTES